MSSTTQTLLLLLVLVPVPGTRSRPATEDQELAPRWLMPERMKNQLQTIPVTASVKFHCQATGNPPPSVQWYKNGIKITADQRKDGLKIRNHTRTLEIKSALPSQGGNFTCVVENTHGSLNHTFRLDVVEIRPSRLILQDGLPADQTADVGSDVTFECKVLNEPSAHIQWLKNIAVNSSDVGPDGLPYVQVLESSGKDGDMEVLTLRNVSLDDAGVFTCLTGNSIGISYRSARLRVVTRSNKMKPSRPILQDGLPADQTADVGSDVTFECKVLNEPSAHIQWLKHIAVNGSDVGPDGLPYVQVLKSSGKDGDMEVLTLRNVSLDDAGVFTCLTGNSIGFSHRSARLRVVTRSNSKIPQTLEIQT